MFHKRYPPVGSSPGAFAQNNRAVETRVYLIEYTAGEYVEREIEDLETLVACGASEVVSWVEVKGLGTSEVLRRLGEIFGVHPLAMADVVNVPGRSKVEEYDNFVFIISAMVARNEIPAVRIEQVSIILGKHFVITFQENYDDILEPVRDRLRQCRGIIRRNGPDYLAYAILDSLIDGYFPVLESLGEFLETLERNVIGNPSKMTVRLIYQVKRELLKLRRSIWPQREALQALTRDENKFFKRGIRLYLRDCYDHCVQIIDVIETYRELCGGFTDIYLSSISNRLNEVMKVLTIISTIFIPLSFLTSIYGMNFEGMPEIHYKWGYPVFWLIILFLGVVMLFFFYRRGWLSSDVSQLSDEPDQAGAEGDC